MSIPVDLTAATPLLVGAAPCASLFMKVAKSSSLLLLTIHGSSCRMARKTGIRGGRTEDTAKCRQAEGGGTHQSGSTERVSQVDRGGAPSAVGTAAPRRGSPGVSRGAARRGRRPRGEAGQAARGEERLAHGGGGVGVGDVFDRIGGASGRDGRGMGKARFAIGEISGQRRWSGATYQWERGDIRRGGTTKGKK